MNAYLSDRPFIRPVPFGDEVFARLVERCVAALEADGSATVEDLERRLRSSLPHAVVRRTELDAPHQQAWYVYREGRWVPPREATWWLEPDLPKLELDPAGFIWKANEAARGLLCGGACQLVGRHFTDFALADPRGLATELSDGYHIDGVCEAAGELRSLLGDVVVVEYLMEARAEGGSCVTMRPLPGLAPERPAERRSPFETVVCEPASDGLFERYARVVVERMPGPQAYGVQLRLRRLYPLATAELDGEVLVCRRDDWPDPPAGWWETPGLPRVEFDRQSLIHHASPELQVTLGADAVGRFWQELTLGQGPDEVEATEVLFELHGTETVIALTGPGGPRFLYAHIAEQGDLMAATLMPVLGQAAGSGEAEGGG